MKYLALALLLSVPCLGGITKNVQLHWSADCGTIKSNVEFYYRVHFDTGNPKYNDFVECDIFQMFQIKGGDWKLVPDLKVGDRVISDVLKTTTKSINFPISKIEKISEPAEMFVIRNCAHAYYPASKAWIRTRNLYQAPERPSNHCYTEQERCGEAGLSFMDIFEIEAAALKAKDPSAYDKAKAAFSEELRNRF